MCATSVSDVRFFGLGGIMKNKFFAALAASTILACAQPAAVQAQSTPAFRVPVGAEATNANVPDTYAWLQQIGSCSTTCGTGTRTTSYQCQNVADYDYSGGGYGPAEADAMCTASVGAKPAGATESCTVYTGCGYDWVKPAVQQTVKPFESNPIGRLGCGYVNQKFSPYCQRTGGGGNLTLPAGDYRFCSGDRPDYDDVAAGNPDALGYDRDGKQLTSCTTSDHDWISTSWGSWSSTCSTTATRTRAVTCKRRFDAEIIGAASENAACGASKPAASETAPVYSSCTYTYNYGAYGAWSSGCDSNATRTRTATCMRSNGDAVADSDCTAAGVTKAAVSETSAQYGSCSYSFQAGAWSAYSSTCSASATRNRSVICQRSNGDTVPDTECTSRGQTKPATTETSAQYGSCSYSWSTGSYGSWSSGCSNTASRTRSVWCKRDLDGAVQADSSCNAATRPASSETAGQYGSCSYSAGGAVSAWSGWSSSCSTSATRSRTYQCVRSNDGGTIVASTECTSRGVNLTETQTGAVYDSCSYSWAQGGFGAWSSGCSTTSTRTQSVWCRRDVDGAAVGDAYCNAGARPASSETAAQYGSCSYYAGGSVSAWSGWNSTCSANAQRTRTYQCVRSNDGGQVVASTECSSRGVNLTETETAAVYSGCSYNWAQGGWSGWSSGCSNSATRTQSVWCRRDVDGATVADANCNAATRPPSSETSGQYGSCSYYTGGSVSGWSGWASGCSSNTTRTRTYQCIRSNDGGQAVASSECTNRGVNLTETQSGANYASCTYRIEDAGLGACQTNNTAPHYWRCIRNETGEQVDSAAYCGRSNPTYDSCTYNWSYSASYGSWSACSSGGSQTRTMTLCQRSDGASVAASYCNNAGYPSTQSQSCTPPYVISCTGAWQDMTGTKIRWFCTYNGVDFNSSTAIYSEPQTVVNWGTGSPRVPYTGRKPTSCTRNNMGDETFSCN
jgi:hypothetical protein